MVILLFSHSAFPGQSIFLICDMEMSMNFSNQLISDVTAPGIIVDCCRMWQCKGTTWTWMVCDQVSWFSTSGVQTSAMLVNNNYLSVSCSELCFSPKCLGTNQIRAVNMSITCYRRFIVTQTMSSVVGLEEFLNLHSATGMTAFFGKKENFRRLKVRDRRNSMS